jgi:ribonucleoside-diphosphate reductase subunit M1
MFLDKSNQKHLGTIKSSNLCMEIIEHSAPDETAMCNLAALALPIFIVNGQYDFQKLYAVTKVITYSLNCIIDINSYPIPEARRLNFRHRPVCRVSPMLSWHFAYPLIPLKPRNSISDFETIYHAALEASSELAERDGPYETWMGSPT